MILFNALMGYISVMLGQSRDFTSSMQFRAFVGIPAAMFLYLPLCLKRDMSAFAYGGVASVVALCYVAAIMVWQAPWYYA